MTQTRNRKKALRRKRQLQRLAVFAVTLLIVFLLGFIFGTQAASKSKKVRTVSVSAPQKMEKIEQQSVELPWNLQLVNHKNALDKKFEPENMKQLTEDIAVDSRIYEPAKEMLDAARADGVRILCVSGYRSYDRQDTLYKNKVERLQRQKGYSIKKARAEAATEVAAPGTSEHQLGLALDLTDASYTGLDEKQETTAAYKWLSKHCHEYGFIVRYPVGKTDVTGIIYEPWHFRYVGKKTASEIMAEGITLEEYVENHF